MAADPKDGQNKLSKNIREQNLKFSVEFHDGDEREYEEDFDEGVDDTNDVTDSDPTEMEANLAEPETADRDVNGTTGDRSKAQPRSPERPAGISSPQRVVTTQRKTETAVHNPAMSRAQGGAADKNGQQNGDTNSKNGRTRERLERKRKWNTKPEEKPGVNKKDEGVKLPPIQSRYSPSQPPTSNASSVKQKNGETGEIPIQARIRGPGPAHYMLPTTMGRHNSDNTKRQSPAFSFGSRTWSFKSDSPGPAYSFDPLLGPRGKENRPSFSFGVRPKTPASIRHGATPGPGAYNTDSPPLWEKRAPQYSISPRHKMRSVDVVPAGNVYHLPSTLGDRVPHQKGGTAFSISPRRNKMGPSEDLANTPGPAKYGAFSPALTKRKSPEYTLQGRNFTPMSKSITPGPGAYSPQEVSSHLEQSPRHVIGTRHSEFKMPTLTPADCD